MEPKLNFSEADLTVGPPHVPVILSADMQIKELMGTLADLQQQKFKIHILRVMNNHGSIDTIPGTDQTYDVKVASLDRAQHLIYTTWQDLMDRVTLA